MRPALAVLLVTACVGDITAPANGVDTPPTPDTELRATFDPAFKCEPGAAPLEPTPIHRLSKTQWVASLSEALSPLAAGDRQALLASLAPQLDLVPEDGSPIGSQADYVVTQSHADAVFNVSMALAGAVAASNRYSDALLSVCGPGSTRASLTSAVCQRKLVDALGKKLFRRPLSDAEAMDFVAFYGTLGADGLAGLLARFFAHPRAYYVFNDEGQLLAGTEGADATYRLSRYELAAKLTFLFWDAPPDDALRAAVESLDADLDANQLLERVLSDPRAAAGVQSFYRSWLRLDRLPPLPGLDTAEFRAFAAGGQIGEPGHHHRDDMIQEVLDLGAFYTLTTEGRYEDLLTSPYSFARTRDLARLYGVEPWDGTPQRLVSQRDRSGLLTRAALLMSGSEETNPILKGRELRIHVLCDELPAPPANLDIRPVRVTPDKTMRQAVEEATSAAVCQACHTKMNPLGFITEGFDALGRARSSDNGHSIDGSGIAALFSGDKKRVQGPTALAQHIVDSGKGRQCFTRKVFEYAYGHAEPAADGCDLERVRTAPTLKGMFKELVRRDAFEQRRTQ